MDTSNSVLRDLASADSFCFYLGDLYASSEPEEQELAKRCEKLLVSLLEKLNPVLKYVCTPRQVGLGEGGCVRYLAGPLAPTSDAGQIYIDRVGGMHVYVSEGVLVERRNASLAWHTVRFNELLAGLRTVLAEAETKREAHLASIRQRRELLDKAMAALGIDEADTAGGTECYCWRENCRACCPPLK